MEIFEFCFFVGGKVGSWVDRDGNYVEMGLYVFFGCYYEFFELMKKVEVFKNFCFKEYIYNFINKGGKIGFLDFCFFMGVFFNGLKVFFVIF